MNNIFKETFSEKEARLMEHCSVKNSKVTSDKENKKKTA